MKNLPEKIPGVFWFQETIALGGQRRKQVSA